MHPVDNLIAACGCGCVRTCVRVSCRQVMFRNCITCFAFTVLTVVSRVADAGDTDWVNVAFTERTGECVQESDHICIFHRRPL